MFELSPDEALTLLNVSPLALSCYVLLKILLATNPAAINWPTLANHCRVSIAKIRRLADQLQQQNLIKIASTSNQLVVELTAASGRQIDRQTGRHHTAPEQPVAMVSSNALQKNGRQSGSQTGRHSSALYNERTHTRAENINNISLLDNLEINNNYSGSNEQYSTDILLNSAREEFSDKDIPNWPRWEEFLSREYQIQLHQLKHPSTIQMLADWAKRQVTIGDARTGIAHAKAVLATRGQTLPAYPSYYRRFVITAQQSRLQEKEKVHENIVQHTQQRSTQPEPKNKFMQQLYKSIARERDRTRVYEGEAVFISG